MSSNLRHYSQIDPRTKYFLTISAGKAWTYTGTPGDSVGLITNFVYADISSYAANILLKDMGRSIVAYDQLGSGAVQQAIFRQVQVVSGLTTEGVSDTAYTSNGWGTFWIPVWVAGAGVFGGYVPVTLANVARTG